MRDDQLFDLDSDLVALTTKHTNLLAGPVSAVTQIHDPGSWAEWRLPDLFWPEDRRWFIATDMDFWSLYIGGDQTWLFPGHLPARPITAG